jgi:uncharacterized protein YndB with AHSA1/START domain
MLKKIAIAVLVVVAAILGYAATKPDTFQIQRTARINAPPERIFPYINDLHQFRQWSPYEKLDPAMQRTYGGPESGHGATYAWQGNAEAGKGSMRIAESSPPSRVTIDLHFDVPFEADNTVVFTLVPQGGATDVTWAMHGASPYISKLISTFIDFDGLVGRDFEDGLNNLKRVAEAKPAEATT